MNRSQLEARYPLIRPLAGEASQTHLARSGTGAIVMVHFLDASTAAWRGGILQRLGQVDPDRRERILEVADVDGKGVVVTRFLMDFRSFPDWIRAGEGENAPPDAATGEFERLFGRAAAPPLDALPHGPSDPPPTYRSPSERGDTPPTEVPFPALPDPSPSAERVQPDDRGREAADPPGAPSGPHQAPIAGPPEGAAGPHGPGEFTRQFGAAQPPANASAAVRGTPGSDSAPPPPAGQQSAPASEPPAADGPGEFTRQFGAMQPHADPSAAVRGTPGSDAAPPPPAGQQSAPGSEPPAADGPGEFTRQFGAVQPPADPSAAVRGTPGSDAAPPPPPDERSTPPSDPPAGNGPGEFTRQFGAMQPAGDDSADELPVPLPRDPVGESRETSRPPGDESRRHGDATAADEPGEFTRMFRAAQPGSGGAPEPFPTVERGDESRETSRPSGDASRRHGDAPAADEPGEFTRMFRAAQPPEGRRSTTPPEDADPPRAAQAAPPSADGAPAGPEESSSDQPGEFTRMFRAAQTPRDEPPAPSPRHDEDGGETLPDGGHPTPRKQRDAQEPGEFTRMFRAAQTPPPPPQPPSSEGASRPSDARGSAGEFTRAFRSPEPPPSGGERPREPLKWSPLVSPPEREKTDSGPSSAGEFTQMFQKLGASPPPPTTPPPATPPPAAPREPLWPSAQAGAEDRYRDRLFDAPPPPPQATPRPEPPAARQEPPRLPVDPELPPLPADMAPQPPPPPPMAGEYTRMIAAQTPPPARAAPPAGPSTPPPAAAASSLPPPAAARPSPGTGLLIAFVVVVILALALVLYLVLSSPGVADSAAELPTDSIPAAPAPGEAVQ